jgi:hypothetical protein
MKIDRSHAFIIVLAAAATGAAFADPPGKGDDGNSRRFTERGVITSLEKSYEVDKLDVYGHGAGGSVRVNRDCDGCTPISLRIVAATKVFVDGKEIPVARVDTVDDLRGVVLTKPNSPEITRILAFKN